MSGCQKDGWSEKAVRPSSVIPAGEKSAFDGRPDQKIGRPGNPVAAN
jgi:hypothetical protein